MNRRNTAYADAVERLLRKIAAEIFVDGTPDDPVTVVVAGGAAVHLYTGARVSKDLDAEFLSRVLKPDVVVMYDDENGRTRGVHLDRAYSSALGLMHEDYLERVRQTQWTAPGLDIRVLAPVDLVISKLGRWAEHDRADVRSLVDAGLVDRDELERLAEQALSYYVGNKQPVRRNLQEALAMFAPAASANRPSKAARP